jgi:hypothetical protein
MKKYNDLLEEVRTKLVEFRLFTARDYLPKMYYTLREEFTPENARDRIEKDCRGIWRKRTIGKFLPDEAKNSMKVKAGRLRKKRPNCAALIAAQREKQEVITIDNTGKSYIENPIDYPPLKPPDIDLVLGEDNSKPDLLNFEFALKFKDIQQYMAKLYPTVKDSGEVWFSGIIDRNTGIVTHARPGKTSMAEKHDDRNISSHLDDNLDDNDITI